MKMAIVAAFCHAVSGIPAPVCHEEVVLRTDDGGLQVCNFAQAIIADFQRHTKFGDPEWSVGRYKCTAGDYQRKDEL